MKAPVVPTRLDCPGFVIEARSLEKRFGPDTVALAGLDLEVPAGAVYVLAGPDGAGKSTTLRVLLDLVRADRGTAYVLGIETTSAPAVVRARIGYVPETGATAYGCLTAAEVLRHHATFYEAWDATYADWLCRRLDLPLQERMGSLSRGAARSVMLVSALAHRPPVLLLDEPIDGLDPLAREGFSALLKEHTSVWETTVLWCTRHAHEVERLADHLGVLSEGRLVLQAPCDMVRRRLRRYRAVVPEGWMDATGLNGEVLLKEATGREITWTVWGEESEVVERLSTAGAALRDVAPLSLEEASSALLRVGATA